MEDNARTNQLPEGRCFIYITHTKQGVRVFASRELSPIGVGKRLLPRDDRAAEPARVLIDELLRLARRNGLGGRGGLIPNADRLSEFVAAAAEKAGVSDAVFLRRTPAYSARILVTL